MDRLPRSYLFVPATRPERIGKAIDCGAEAVIVDFEDAVAPDDKASAREALASPWASLRARASQAKVELLVRINAADTAYHEGDLQWCAAQDVDSLVLPKAEAAGVRALHERLPGTRCHPLLETATGFATLRDVATAPGVARLLFGSIDLMFDLDVANEGEPLHYFRSRLVLHSRAAGLPAPVDGVCTAIGDAAALDAETQRARAFGFGAKLLIHPGQVAGVHAGLAPSARERAWAQRIIDAAAAAQGAAVAVDGKMVDRPVLERARRILANAS
jgi:citrate lyase subunit beta/citryl-CoA lyase